MTEETADDLSAAEYKVRVDGKIVIEPKEDIKERLGRSPGKGDALLLTFAFPVSKRLRILGSRTSKAKPSQTMILLHKKARESAG